MEIRLLRGSKSETLHIHPLPRPLTAHHLWHLVVLFQAREGHGGGFNERQDRASVATVEVDEDGYDDFGRKKIKARADKKAKEVRGVIKWYRIYCLYVPLKH